MTLWYFTVNFANFLNIHSKIPYFWPKKTVKFKVIYSFLIYGNSMYLLQWYTILDFTVFYCCYLTVFYRDFYGHFLQCTVLYLGIFQTNTTAPVACLDLDWQEKCHLFAFIFNIQDQEATNTSWVRVKESTTQHGDRV